MDRIDSVAELHNCADKYSRIDATMIKNNLNQAISLLDKYYAGFWAIIAMLIAESIVLHKYLDFEPFASLMGYRVQVDQA